MKTTLKINEGTELPLKSNPRNTFRAVSCAELIIEGLVTVLMCFACAQIRCHS